MLYRFIVLQLLNMKVRENIKEFISTIPSGVTLVAATKYVDAIEMKKLYNAGINNFGENRVDAFLMKYQSLKELDISWHFIGHLQRNKAKEVINKIDFLHSLDSLKLAEEIEKYRDKPLNVFVEVSINLEENKNGVPFYEAESFIKSLLKYKKINVVGLMMMTVKLSEDKEKQFQKLVDLKQEIEKSLNIQIPYLSMGMSDDYLEAIKEGATHIRLGRILFKE